MDLENNTQLYAITFLLSILLGFVYFRLLKRNLEGLYKSSHPYLHYFGGYALRLGLILLAAYLVVRMDWRLAILFLIGFFLSKALLLSFEYLSGLKKR